MKIGMIGTGRMGTGLGRLWAGAGHELFFGSRDAARGRETADVIGHGAQGGTHQEAAAFGNVLLLVTPWSATPDLVRSLGPLADKIVIDATNPLQDGRPALPNTTSGAEELARIAPDAHFVKAFNSIHFANLVDPIFDGLPADAFYCGDDQAAKAAVAQLAEDIGLRPVDCGLLASARLLEPLALLWIRLASQEGKGTAFAFRIIER